MEKWLEVDLDNLKYNVESLKNYFKVPIQAVIKQNAYGLGGVAVATLLEQAGINFFAVTNVSEGIELRRGGIVSPILVFAPVFADDEELNSLWYYNLTPGVYSLEAAEKLNSHAASTGQDIKVHIKVDSGMGRMGFAPDELLSCAGRLKELNQLKYEGIFTHYSNAFEPQMDYTKKQLHKFLKLIDSLNSSGLKFPLKYSANSLAALKFPETHMDMVTIGSAFLGNSSINPEVPLKKVYRCQARVLQVRTIKKGQFIGYSNTFKAVRDTKVAVIPIGYTDGFGVQKKIESFRFADFIREQVNLIKTFLRPSKNIFFKGTPLRVLGKTSLQLTVVEIGDLPVKAGDLLTIEINPLFANSRLPRLYTGANIAGGGSRDFMAEAAATAQNEVACTVEE